ncbi:hypothetical protein BLOT_014647 [Blomia tropicalis]|nr:hypothetical protein BLOT_014647 [Blomia tropicalis]
MVFWFATGSSGQLPYYRTPNSSSSSSLSLSNPNHRFYRFQSSNSFHSGGNLFKSQLHGRSACTYRSNEIERAKLVDWKQSLTLVGRSRGPLHQSLLDHAGVWPQSPKQQQQNLDQQRLLQSGSITSGYNSLFNSTYSSISDIDSSNMINSIEQSSTSSTTSTEINS